MEIFKRIFSIFILAFTFYNAVGQKVVTYRVTSIEKSTNNKNWNKILFSHCIISQDLDKFITTIYNGSTKTIYNGYDVDLPKEDSTIGSIYVSRQIDNFGKECTIEQIIWNGNLKGSSMFSFYYKDLTFRYQTEIVEPKQTDR